MAKHPVCYTAAAAVLLSAVRVVHQAGYIEPGTGFYRGPLLYLWLFYGAGLVFLALTAYEAFSRPQTAEFRDTRRTGLFCLLASAAVAAEIFLTAVKLPGEWSGGFQSVYKAVLLVFEVLSCLVLLLLSRRLLQGRLRPCKDSMLFAIPVLWQCMRLVQSFTEHPTAAHIPHQLLELFLLAGEAAFSLYSAQIYTRTGTVRAEQASVFLGVSCGVCAFVLVLPQAAAPLLREGFSFSLSGQAVSFFYALFACSFALDLLKSGGRAAPRNKTSGQSA